MPTTFERATEVEKHLAGAIAAVRAEFHNTEALPSCVSYSYMRPGAKKTSRRQPIRIIGDNIGHEAGGERMVHLTDYDPLTKRQSTDLGWIPAKHVMVLRPR